MLNSISPSWDSVDSLNQAMDNNKVLSDDELQKELSIYTNTEFIYDDKPVTKKKSIPPNMHSLLNVKLASLGENNYHTYMSPDAINRFYDNESPDCTPPNGYYSPNPTPPNGFYSPNPTPPNGVYLTPTTGFQGIVNPPITFYNNDTEEKEDEEEDFIKTMGLLAKKEKPAPLSKEDKRKRNTAASARFRVKKKLREQVLQKTADEMTEKAKMFENRVHELEREVQWLKALIVEKNDGKLEQLLLQQQYNAMINYHRPS